MLGWSKEYSGQGKSIAGAAKMSSATDVTYSDPHKPLKFDETIFDTGKFFNGDGKAHIHQSGIYIITGEVAFNPNEGNEGARFISIYKNGTQSLVLGANAPNETTAGIAPTVSIVAQLNSGDYIELCGACGGNKTAPITATVVPEVSRLSIARLGD